MAEVKKLPEREPEEPVPTGTYPEFYRLLMTRMSEILPQEASARENLDEQQIQAPGDEGDLSVLDTSADYFTHLANSHQRAILEIRGALDRMNRGVYGVCESCESPISLERLKKIPEARLCIDCQARLERTQMVAHPGGKRSTL